MLPTNKRYLYKLLLSSFFSFGALIITKTQLLAQTVVQASHAESYAIQA